MTLSDEEDNYCVDLYQKVKKHVDYSHMSHYEQFVLSYALLFKSEESFKAAYDRAWKAKHGILITADEFKAEMPEVDKDTAEELYETLAALANAGKLNISDVYAYAKYKWCKNPEAIVAYEHSKGWEVNDCGVEISKEAARIKVCEEWGFEASRVRIIGTPYYDATDWHFIRFDCKRMSWLWKNGNLYQVYS